MKRDEFMGKKFLTASEVAEHLQVHVDTVYALVQKGELPGAKIGKQWRFDATEIQRWFTTRAQQQPEPPDESPC